MMIVNVLGPIVDKEHHKATKGNPNPTIFGIYFTSFSINKQNLGWQVKGPSSGSVANRYGSRGNPISFVSNNSF